MSDLFKVHLLNEDGIRKALNIANAYEDILAYLETVCIEGRDLAIVRTKLQEASFFSKRAMAMSELNHKD